MLKQILFHLEENFMLGLRGSKAPIRRVGSGRVQISVKFSGSGRVQFDFRRVGSGRVLNFGPVDITGGAKPPRPNHAPPLVLDNQQ